MSRVEKRDTDYLTLSSRVHAMETRLLGRDRMERMIEAKDLEEAAKVLTECGYGEMSELTGGALEDMLSSAQAELYRDLGSYAVAVPILDVFRCKYDYQNAKVLVKAAALSMDGAKTDALLASGGRYEPKKLKDAFDREDLRMCSQFLRQGVEKARETLGATGDPQLADFILDRAYYEELTALAKDTGSQFLQGYVALSIDAANLRSAVRASRLGKGTDFLRQVLLPGGNVSAQSIAAVRGEELSGLFHSGPLGEAAELGASLSAPGSGALTEFERLCDNAIMDYLGGGRRTAFGEQPIIGYLYAREAEMTTIRIIMTGRMAGLDGDTIRQRLRQAYE